MEINITQFYRDSNPTNYSASCAELGPDAGKTTWGNAVQAARTTKLLDTPEKLEAMRKWARATGAWNDAEIMAWDEVEIEALFIQLVAGDMREKRGLDWPAYYELSEAGQVSGALFEADGSIYYTLEG